MNQLKTKIEEVKAKLGVSTMQLSERIGKNPYYLYKVVNGVSTERQKELMLELDLVANGGTVMTEREVITNLSEKLVEAQDRLHKQQDTNRALNRKLELSGKYFSELERLYDLRWSELVEYKRQYRDLVAIMIVVGIIAVLGLAIWSAV